MIDWAKLLVNAENSPTLLDMFKQFLGIDPADTSQDAALKRALNTAGPAIERHLDRTLAKSAVTEDFSAYVGTVMLQHSPVEAGSVTVTLNGEASTAYETYTETGGLTYVTRMGHRRDVPIDWRCFDQVTVAYTAGFDSLPVDLATAIIYTASGLFMADGTGTLPTGAGDVSRMTIHDVGSISYDTGGGGYMAGFGVVPPVAAEMLLPYRRINA